MFNVNKNKRILKVTYSYLQVRGQGYIMTGQISNQQIEQGRGEETLQYNDRKLTEHQGYYGASY